MTRQVGIRPVLAVPGRSFDTHAGLVGMSGRIWAGELFRPAGLLADRHGGHSSGFERRLCRAMDTIAAFEELLSRN